MASGNIVRVQVRSWQGWEGGDSSRVQRRLHGILGVRSGVFGVVLSLLVLYVLQEGVALILKTLIIIILRIKDTEIEYVEVEQISKPECSHESKEIELQGT